MAHSAPIMAALSVVREGKASCRIDGGPMRPCIVDIRPPTCIGGAPVPGEWAIETRITWDELRRADANRGSVEVEISTGDGTLRGTAYLTNTDPSSLPAGTEVLPLQAWLNGDGRPRIARHNGEQG